MTVVGSRKKALVIVFLVCALSYIVSGCGGGAGNSSKSISSQDTIESDTNSPPIVFPVSLEIDDSLAYITQLLIGIDSDGDVLTYELISELSGEGYSHAYVNPDSGTLYITLKSGFNGELEFEYRATDGMEFSSTAKVKVKVSKSESRSFGYNSADPRTYFAFDNSVFDSKTEAIPGSDASTPHSIDLTPFFPIPGQQGSQGSCVGWATSYAVKSYQERVENSWVLNSAKHLFSPAYIYNQINGGRDNGSYIYDALDLIVQKGASTLETMPYNEFQFLTIPSAEAHNEAAKFKGKNWSKLSSVTTGIKGALANRVPVIVGIAVYSQLNFLGGSDAVYNSSFGTIFGYHAVSIIGYDDSRYGGAFKLINSWGQDWGDEGYFWIPYSFAPEVIREAYVLYDAENDGEVDVGEDTKEETTQELPNFQVKSWQINFNPVQSGEGWMEFSVVNTGSGTADAGSDICLLLSENNSITSSDFYVVCESIPFDLFSGQEAVRDANNRINFRFPEHLPDGTYFMALKVDDFGEIEEVNEDDNTLFGESTVTIQGGSSDLVINSWFIYWTEDGTAFLEYEIENGGTSPSASGWNVNLVLSEDYTIGNGNEIVLFSDHSLPGLNPNEKISRTISDPGIYNLYNDYSGVATPSGNYYVALWVDDLDIVDEKNELNNISLSYDRLKIVNDSRSKWRSTRNTPYMYNGRRLPDRYRLLETSHSVNLANGSGVQKFKLARQIDNTVLRGKLMKSLKAIDGVVFPTTDRVKL